MAIDKKISYEMQGKVRNYLGKQKMVRAPLHWQSGPGHPKTQLAYITKPELDLILKKDFHGSLKDGPNVGPSGIMSLNDPGTGRSGSEMSAAETGGSGHGMSASEAAGIRAGAVAAGARGTKAEMRAAKKEFGSAYRGRDRRTGLGGLLGGIGRGLLGFFGGIPGKVMSGILSARNLAKRTGTKIGEFGEEVEEFGNYPTLDRYLNRNTDKYKDKPYRGQGQGYNMSDTGQGNIVQDPDLYKDEMKEFRIRNPVDLTNNLAGNITNNMGANNQFVEDDTIYSSAEGGRVGYERGRVVNPGGYQGEEEGVDSVKHFIMLEQMDKLEKMIGAGLDSDGRLQARLDQLLATSTTGFGTGPDLVLPDDKPDLIPPDDMAQGGIARLL